VEGVASHLIAEKRGAKVGHPEGFQSFKVIRNKDKSKGESRDNRRVNYPTLAKRWLTWGTRSSALGTSRFW
jgi:hypothetical protein